MIYDAAHAFGVRYKGIPAESFGDASVLSFHATKVFSTVEGGAVCWHDGRMEQRLKDLKNFGIRDTEHCEAVGGNAKLDELRAAMGLCNLRHFEEVLARRHEASMLYRELLAGAGDPVPFPSELQADVEPNWSYFPVLFSTRARRDAAFDALAAAGIGSRKYFWPLTCDAGCYISDRSVARQEDPSGVTQPQRSENGRSRMDLPASVARELSSRVLCLPLSPYITPEEIEAVVRWIVSR